MFSLKDIFRRDGENSLYIPSSQVRTCTFLRSGWDQYRHASGLLIVTNGLDEALLVQRARWLRYGGTWSITGGYRQILDEDDSTHSSDEHPSLEPSLDCAVYETIEELGRLPSGRIRKTPHTLLKSNGCTYDTFVLEVKASERNRFQPSLDYDELQDWAWHPIAGLTEKEDVHPGLRQFFREYRF